MQRYFEGGVYWDELAKICSRIFKDGGILRSRCGMILRKYGIFVVYWTLISNNINIWESVGSNMVDIFPASVVLVMCKIHISRVGHMIAISAVLNTEHCEHFCLHNELLLWVVWLSSYCLSWTNKLRCHHTSLCLAFGSSSSRSAIMETSYSPFSAKLLELLKLQ